jgi:ribokinase
MEGLLRARMAVIGHVEWADMLVVDRLPRPGEIRDALEFSAAAAGSAAVAAVQMLKLTGAATFFTALADDDAGRRAGDQLRGERIVVHDAGRRPPQRRAVVHLDERGERTITIFGERLVPHGDDPLPWDQLGDVDGVYVAGGDATAMAAARRARWVVATPRAEAALKEGGVHVDVLIHSGADARERVVPELLDPPPRIVVTTLGSEGGRWSGEAGEGTWKAAPLPGPVVDAYGAGDSFAGGVTTGVAAGLPIADAVALGARYGAACMTGRGPYAAQLDLR